MSSAEIQAWISIGTGVIAIGTFIYAFLTRGSKANADRLVNVEKSVGELIASHVDLKHRVDNYREQMLALPNKDDFHGIEMTVASMAGDIKVLSGVMNRVSHKVDTIDTYLMDEKKEPVMNYAEVVAEDCRLILLKALAAENDYSLNETILVHALEEFGHKKARGYVRQQLTILESENEAVFIREAGTVMIATITQRGLDHIEGRAILPGVKRPSPPDQVRGRLQG